MNVELYSFADTKEYKRFNRMSGIYALVYKNEIIYVGQSCNVRQRLISHHGYRSVLRGLYKRKQPYSDSTQFRINFYTFIKENMKDIQFLAIPVEPIDLIKTEKHYIEKYKPRFNYAGVVIAY